MVKEKYASLMDALKEVPNPRKARGKRYGRGFLLALIAAALASGERTPHAITQWIALHATELLQALVPPRSTVPSESTIRTRPEQYGHYHG
jgi:hypothetical protein